MSEQGADGPRNDQPRLQWYSWGSGASGLLAQGDSNDSDEPNPITAPPFADSASVASVACSGVYSLSCTSDGQLWHCGDTHQSCSLRNSSTTSHLLLLPVRITLPKHIVRVACGWSHCGCITDEGELYMWGNNKQHQLGLPAHSPTAALSFCPNPTLVPLPSPVASIACGWRHTLALTQSHELLGWGDNRFGQLSVPDSSSLPVPTSLSVPSLPASSHIASVLCGWRFSVLVTSCGRVYCCGDNVHGQCGLDSKRRQVDQWTEVAAVRAVQAAVGWSHCLLLDAHGRVWTFGRRSMGGAGTGRDAGMSWSSMGTCEQVALSQHVRITSVVCGSESCLCIDSGGGLWSWGWNEHGNVGKPIQLPENAYDAKQPERDGQIVWEPRRLRVGGRSARVVAVAAGGASVFAAVANTVCGSRT